MNGQGDGGRISGHRVGGQMDGSRSHKVLLNATRSRAYSEWNFTNETVTLQKLFLKPICGLLH